MKTFLSLLPHGVGENKSFKLNNNVMYMSELCLSNPLVPSVLNIGRWTKILIYEGILKRIYYERCAYESVDEKSLYILGYLTKSDEKRLRAQMG